MISPVSSSERPNRERPIRVVLTGGGTGGHIYPALAVAQALQDHPEVESICYIGNATSLESQLVPEQGILFETILFTGMPRRPGVAFIKWLIQLFQAVQAAKKHLQAFKPDVVFGTGGYVSAPVLFAAKSLGIPYVIHEPDAMPGLVNRLMSRWATLATGAFQESAALLKARTFVATGNPIRAQIHPISATETQEERLSRKQAAIEALGLGFSVEKPVLLVVGGSQGAKTLNQAVIQGLPDLVDRLGVQIIHQTGMKLFDEAMAQVPEAYRHHMAYAPMAYFKEMWHVLAVSDLALCRAGSLSLSEMFVAGLPTVLVPYPFAASDHQRKNAQAAVRTGSAVVIEDAECDASTLVHQLEALLAEPETLARMRQASLAQAHPDATVALVSRIISVATGNLLPSV